MNIAYVAGFIDGEGCVSIGVAKKRYVCPNIQVSNTNLTVLKLFKEQFGGSIQNRLDKRKNRRPSWTWWIAANKALKVLEEVKPFLIIKKPQAEILLGLKRCSLKRNKLGRLVRRMTPEIIKDNFERVAAIRKLNKRGI